MTFVHPLLLAGLVLVGIPILLHLIMRQKPRHLFFPAVRFLIQRQRVNQRKLQLRHLLLLAMRIMLLAAVCLALARPKIFSERFFFSGDRRVAAVLIFDTSYSMEYTSGNRSRLDEAKRRSQELLDELPDGSRVAILDTAEPGGEWLLSLSQARERIAALELRPANFPVTTSLTPAYDLFAKLEQEAETPEEAPVRFLYVFSDRAQACWNANQNETLQRMRDRLPPPGVIGVFVDLGAENPADLAIAGLELPRQALAANERVVIRAPVRATGMDYDTQLLCRIDGEVVDRKPVQLAAGQSKVISFERRGLAPGFHQVEVALETTDALPFNNIAFATFEVRGPRQVLILADAAQDALPLQLALETRNAFTCAVKETSDRFVIRMTPDDLRGYQAVCLLSVARPPPNLWACLENFVQGGGGVAVIPGGDVDRGSYNSDTAQKLLPARMVKVVAAKEPGATWNQADLRHPFMVAFGEWSKHENVDFFQPGLEPAAMRYWDVDPRPGESQAVVSYTPDKQDKAGPPALLERQFDHKTIRGHVLMFTTPLDDRHVAAGKNRWNNYLQNSFYLVLVNKAVGYLTGDAEEGSFNHTSGQVVNIPVPAAPRFPTYTVQGPGLSSADALVPREENQGELSVTRAVMPGNYAVVGTDAKRMAYFSLNVLPDESQLAPVAKEIIEAVLGPDALLPLDSKKNLHEALQSHWNQPVELLPWLMIVVLLILAAENLLANKFYRREPAEENVAS
jgi:hypothetical protein